MTLPFTEFLNVLDAIHKKTDMRFGQILNNALQMEKGRNKHEGSGACYDTFYIRDEELTRIVKAFGESIGVLS